MVSAVRTRAVVTLFRADERGGLAPVAPAAPGWLSFTDVSFLFTAKGARGGPDLSSVAGPTPGIRLATDMAGLPGWL